METNEQSIFVRFFSFIRSLLTTLTFLALGLFCETRFDEFFYKLGNGLHYLVLIIAGMSGANIIIGTILDNSDTDYSIFFPLLFILGLTMVAHPFHYLLMFIHLITARICIFPIIAHYARQLYKCRNDSIEWRRNQIQEQNKDVIIDEEQKNVLDLIGNDVVQYWMDAQDNDASLSVDNTKAWKGTQGYGVIMQLVVVVKIFVKV
ncbi:MAG: hypothetical protein EZS28_035966 [Streblomastix strix]|uniref:Uncharacterized protein n=1 Tax=Streblomastix strix TaxID=222440 RepID=A0A5J4UDL3_9EUKA|nr:MAG: hypothetical protein EZS28_035966 [Streblomastix strix]